ncbi:iron-sulfur cluster assembly scaffold protein [Streptomyces sp. SAS_267]|uniref:iron-sulfur cluster assembly scaffold protein n=1 Tax=unclassified Streptomyces TaxID=2593676 RepID=UPI0036FB4B45
MPAANWEIQAVLSDHFKHPRHWGMLHRARHRTGASPGCGDEQIIYVDDTAGTLSQVSFHATGCALSRACTSLLLEHVESRTWSDVTALDLSFFTQILGSDIVHSRPKCTLLGLTILHNLDPGRETDEPSP